MSLHKNNFNFPQLTGSKRPRTDSGNNSPIPPVFDRFFKITRVDGSFSETSPFVLHKALTSKFGTLADTKKLSDGTILIEVITEKQSDIAVSLNKLHDFDVTTTPHKSLNTVKGVITCKDLQNCSDDEILENFKEQGVTEIYRIPQKKDNSKPSFTFIVSFKLHQLPATMHAGWYSLRVRPYIPSPMRCFVCQRFGHTASKCSYDKICPSCGHSDHSSTPCSKTPKCINCNDSHSPRYKGCSKFKMELEIQKLKTLDKISYFDAKRKYFSLHPSFPVSFSSVAQGSKPKQVSISIQCDLPPISTSTLTSPPSKTPPSPSPLLKPPPSTSLPPPNHPPRSPIPKSLPDLKISLPNKQIHKDTVPKSSLNRPTSISKDPPKKPRSRSNKSTPSSSSESILDITTNDNLMDFDPINSSKSNTKKK